MKEENKEKIISFFIFLHIYFMDINQKIELARSSKHTEAILLLYNQKDFVASWVREIVKSLEKEDLSEDEKKHIESLKKVIALVSEHVFNECIQILTDDKKDE